MIISLSGGLGNQLFQYALSVGLKKQCESIRFDTRLCAHGKGCGLDQFNVSYRKISKVSSMIWRVALKCCRDADFVQTESAPFCYDDIDCNKRYLQGCWQNLGYFKEVKSSLQKEFVYKGTFSDKQRMIVEQMLEQNSVIVHVRRGDYLKASEIYRIVGMDYYQRAMHYYIEKYNDVHFYIFSDDIEWCKENLDGSVCTFIDETISKTAYEDFELMKQGKHFIIANSTFSWWASWLAEYPQKEMIAPRIWFTSEKNNAAVRCALLEEYLTM